MDNSLCYCQNFRYLNVHLHIAEQKNSTKNKLYEAWILLALLIINI